MKLRIMGTTAEVAATVELLHLLDDIEVTSVYGGTYTGAEGHTQRVHVEATVRHAATPARARRSEYRRDDPVTDEPLPPGVEGRPVGGRTRGGAR